MEQPLRAACGRNIILQATLVNCAEESKHANEIGLARPIGPDHQINRPERQLLYRGDAFEALNRDVVDSVGRHAGGLAERAQAVSQVGRLMPL